MASSERFGYEWDTYSEIDPYKEQYKDQFLNWMHPHGSDFFKGKKVLDAGCGMGRNSYWCVELGAKELVAFDLDERSVNAATKTLSSFPHAKVVTSDIYSLPWRDEFDIVFSIGVIHHLEDPKKALNSLHTTLKPGGTLHIWVYGKEGFETFVKVLQPVRRYISSKMPLSLLHALTYMVSIPLYIYLHTRKTHSRSYFNQLRTFKLGHLHSIIFDQLLPSIARYYTKDEAYALLDGFRNVEVYAPPNNNGWIVKGMK